MMMKLQLLTWNLVVLTAPFATSFAPVAFNQPCQTSILSTVDYDISSPTELPDSLDDAADIAAVACASFAEATGPLGRCRVDFDTSAGDETYTILKASTEFMQKFVSAASYAIIPGLKEQRQSEIMRESEARAELREMEEKASNEEVIDEDRKQELISILQNGGRDPEQPAWDGPTVRVYFPDEGNAALARRDWNPTGPPSEALVPPCVQFSSCGGVQSQDMSNDALIFFFCPKASESEYVEELLQKAETTADGLKLTIFVNPNLVDMGVTGFGMAGRRLRERLIDGLVTTYYLRTLPWGALTRMWPKPFSVWQEDESSTGGYKLIQSVNSLPSNPDVEDIFDVANGLKNEKSGGGGFLDQLGDFVNGMTRL